MLQLAVAAQLKSSKSWRLTKPMRFVARLVRFGFTMEDRQWVAKRMRTLYHQLPLSPSTKKFFSFVYHKLIGRVLRSIHRTVQHRAGFQPPAFKPTPKREGCAGLHRLWCYRLAFSSSAASAFGFGHW
jgi:hypothetical protein